MNLAGVQSGDVVLADRKKRRFYAIVSGKGPGELNVDPIDRRVTYHHVKAREVVEIRRRRRNGNSEPPAEPMR